MTVRDNIADSLEYTASVVRKKRNLRAEVDALYEQLRNIEDVKGLDSHPGWIKVRDVLVNQAKLWRQAAYRLAESNPSMNEKEILINTSLARAATHLLSTIETTLSAERDKNAKLKYLEGIIQESGL